MAFLESLTPEEILLVKYALLAGIGAVFALTAACTLLALRNNRYYGDRAEAIGNMLMDVKCNIEGDFEEHARILNMSPEEYKTEKDKGRILFRAGQEVVGIAEGLRSPFRIWW